MNRKTNDQTKGHFEKKTDGYATCNLPKKMSKIDRRYGKNVIELLTKKL